MAQLNPSQTRATTEIMDVIAAVSVDIIGGSVFYGGDDDQRR